MAQFTDSSCSTSPVSIVSSNFPGCGNIPSVTCEKTSGDLYYAAHCTESVPTPSWRGSAATLYSGPNCTSSPITQSFWWADGVCQLQGSSSMVRSCASDGSLLKVTYCSDSACSQGCNTQAWPLSNSTFCQNSGPSSAVRFTCT
jgi:hypothetical protein